MGKTISTTRAINITTSVTEILPKDPNRVAVIFSNMDTSNVIVGTIPEISLTLGLLLQSSGGFLNPNEIEDGQEPNKRWLAIGAAAVTIYVTEVRKIGKEETSTEG